MNKPELCGKSDKLARMFVFAGNAHSNQKYGDQPYIYHLSQVLYYTSLYTCDVDVLCAAYGHDLIEDTNVTREQITHEFGETVSELIWRVSDEPGATRKIRKAATYQKTAQDTRSALIKVADRIANVTNSTKNGNNLRFLEMYQKEQSDLEHYLRPLVSEQMWIQLENAFKNKL